MSGALSLFARTFLIGVAVAAPVGAMGVLCIERTLHRGWRAGMATGLGIATADGIYASIAAFGVSAVAVALVEWETAFRLFGGLALLLIGLRSALMASSSGSSLESPDPPTGVLGDAGLYASAMVLTLANPMTIIAFTAVFVSAGIAAGPSLAHAATATAGVAAGSLTWWLALVSGCSVLGRGAGPTVRLWMSRVSGGAVAVFGLIAMGSVLP